MTAAAAEKKESEATAEHFSPDPLPSTMVKAEKIV